MKDKIEKSVLIRSSLCSMFIWALMRAVVAWRMKGVLRKIDVLRSLESKIHSCEIEPGLDFYICFFHIAFSSSVHR